MSHYESPGSVHGLDEMSSQKVQPSAEIDDEVGKSHIVGYVAY